MRLSDRPPPETSADLPPVHNDIVIVWILCLLYMGQLSHKMIIKRTSSVLAVSPIPLPTITDLPLLLKDIERDSTVIAVYGAAAK